MIDLALPPVKRVDGSTLWRVLVFVNELTCLECGETFGQGGICPRCGIKDDGGYRSEMPPSVPTLSYLHDGEYELVK